MAGKKKKSRIKKIFKNLAKVALAGGAAYGASKLFGGRNKGNVANTAAMENIIHRSPRPDDYNYPVRIPDHPSNIQSIEGGGSAPMNLKRHISKWFGKKGGRVTGIAKRGFGRALMKGKK
jgi:hypothetical protein